MTEIHDSSLSKYHRIENIAVNLAKFPFSNQYTFNNLVEFSNKSFTIMTPIEIDYRRQFIGQMTGLK